MKTLRKKCIMIRIWCSTYKRDKVWKMDDWVGRPQKGSSKNVGGGGKPSRTLKKRSWITNHEWLTWISKVREKLEIFRRRSCLQWTIIPHGVAGNGKNSAWFQFEIKGSSGMRNLEKKEQIYEGRINVLDMDPVEFEVTQRPQNRSINA